MEEPLSVNRAFESQPPNQVISIALNDQMFMLRLNSKFKNYVIAKISENVKSSRRINGFAKVYVSQAKTLRFIVIAVDVICTWYVVE